MKKELPACPVEVTLELIGSKWTILIVRELLSGTKRFGELGANINGISSKMLTQQLKTMQQNGLINRKSYASIPPKVEYSLTPLGKSLAPVLSVLDEWGSGYKIKMGE